MATNSLEDHMMEAQTDMSDAVPKAMSTVALAILTNMVTRSHTSRGARAAELESFDGSRDKAGSVCIVVTMQLNTFMEERMKSCMPSPSCTEE